VGQAVGKEGSGSPDDPAALAALNARLQKANAELTQREQHRELLLAELNHRVKNILAAVQGLASVTLKGAGGNPRLFASQFSARLRTLARAHDMLTALGWAPPGIEDTVRTALAPWLESGRAAQIDIAGGSTATLSPRQAQALVLAFHELATHATKYGALSTPKGWVAINSEIRAGGFVAVLWAETGGPRLVTLPTRRGFGTRLLERRLAIDLGSGSRVDLRFEPMGLRVEILFRAVSEWPMAVTSIDEAASPVS
jgi:two-component sensor histidine kinase